jgi:TonB family protein
MTFFLLLVIASSIATHARPQNSQEKDKAPQQEKKPEDKKPDTAAKGGIEILSDTLGVEFRPYVEQIRSRIYPAWLRAIPDVAREPEKKQGTAILEFDILKDGRVKGLKLTQSSGDKSMDLAPQMAIISVAPMPQLPVAFRGDYLQIRCRFIYNPGTRAQINPSAGGQKK